MIRLFSVISFFFLFIASSAAQSENYMMDKDALAYRRKMTVPPYGLAKVKKMITEIQAKADPNSGSDAGIEALSTAAFKSLSLREKFTYVMIHAEMTAQSCDIPEFQKDIQARIFGQLISGFDEASWSERQGDFLKENRDSVMFLMQESVMRSKRMGVNYKEAILEINAWEMIPFIIQYVKQNSMDRDGLTLLMLLMKRGEYEAFLTSTSYRKLYGPESNYYVYLNSNKQNEELILDRATAYFNEKKR